MYMLSFSEVGFAEVKLTETGSSAKVALEVIFDLQKRASIDDPRPSLALRKDRIARLIDMLLANSDQLVEAMSEDFAHRSSIQSYLTDILGILPSIKNDYAKVGKWMKSQNVAAGPLGKLGGSARIEWIPRGVVGIISPWNFPVGLALQPLSQAFAAGNRAMVKVSEVTSSTSELLKSIGAKAFDRAELAIITGDSEQGRAFSRLPFDLMFFTGSPNVARHVQGACAENLVPCVLELGGKCPVVIAPDAEIERAAAKIAAAKTVNSGQLCLSPDHVFVPRGKRDVFVAALIAQFSEQYDSLIENVDYSSIVSPEHFDRLMDLVADAKRLGAELVTFNPAGETFKDRTIRKIPPTLILNPTSNMGVMQDEIFGPLLPIIEYDSSEGVISAISATPRPLAVYLFSKDREWTRTMLDHSWSGGVSVNDLLAHAGVEDLPFGGIGQSGMGYYHGRRGFETFSHARAIATASPILSFAKLMAPPHSTYMRKVMQFMLNRETKAAVKRASLTKKHLQRHKSN